MLKNAYLLAKIGADKAENERKFVKNLPKVCREPTSRSSSGAGASSGAGTRRAGGGLDLEPLGIKPS